MHSSIKQKQKCNGKAKLLEQSELWSKQAGSPHLYGFPACLSLMEMISDFFLPSKKQRQTSSGLSAVLYIAFMFLCN